MIIKISDLRPLNSGSEICVCINIKNAEYSEIRRLVILSEQYAEMKLTKGEIDAERFDEIEMASKICSAYKKGLFLLGYGASSERKLHYKLRTKGFDDDISTIAVKMLSEKGYIQEESDAMREAERCISKLWGKKRIINHLYTKGFCDDAVKKVALMLEDTDFAENCKELILKSHKAQFEAASTDQNEKNKLIASLVRMGYSFSQIREASERIASD